MERKFSDILFQSYTTRNIKNNIACGFIILSAIFGVVILVSIISLIVSNGIHSLNYDFFTKMPKPVGEIGGGMANAILGTCILIVIASLIGIPWGIAIGTYLSEFPQSKKWGAIIRFSSEILASIPSIIIGLFVYALMVVPMKRFSALAGGLALGIIMIPTLAKSTEEILKMIPDNIREAGLALGLPRWKVILWIVLRGAKKSILTTIMLAIARISGETAPLLFTAFGNSFWQYQIDQPIASIPIQIYTYAISPYEEWHRLAWAGALVLVALILALNIVTRLIFRSIGKPAR